MAAILAVMLVGAGILLALAESRLRMERFVELSYKEHIVWSDMGRNVLHLLTPKPDDGASAALVPYIKDRLSRDLQRAHVIEAEVAGLLTKLRSPWRRLLLNTNEGEMERLMRPGIDPAIKAFVQAIPQQAAADVISQRASSQSIELASSLGSGEFLDAQNDRLKLAAEINRRSAISLLLLLAATCIGVLAGIWVIWRYALHPALTRIEDQRNALILRNARADAAGRIARMGHWTLNESGDLDCSPELIDVLKLAGKSAPVKFSELAERGRPEDRRHFSAACDRLFRADGVEEFTRILPQRNNRDRVVRERVQSSRTASGRRIIGVAIDVTDLIATQEVVARAARLDSLQLLTRGLAHDLNNVIAALKGNAELMQMKPSDTPARLTSIMGSVSLLSDLVSNLSSAATDRCFKPDIIDLRASVVNVVAMFEKSSTSRTPVTVVAEDTAPLSAKVNRSQFENAVLNLLVNADEAILPGGKIALTLSEASPPNGTTWPTDLPIGRWAMISVEDDGAGMSDAIRQRAIEPFYSTKTAGEVPGRGLGLWSAYQFSRSAGGRLDIASQAGQGTRVCLWLPAA